MDQVEVALSALVRKMWATRDAVADGRHVFTEVECEIRLRPPAVHTRIDVDIMKSRLTKVANSGWRVISDVVFRQARCGCRLHRIRTTTTAAPAVEVVVKEPCALSPTWEFESGWSARVGLSTETRCDVRDLPCTVASSLTYEGERRRVSLVNAMGIRIDLTVPDKPPAVVWMEVEIQNVKAETVEVAVDCIKSALIDLMTSV